MIQARAAAASAAVSLALLAGGCAGFLAQLSYVTGGAKKSADFDGLKAKRVAVVCVSESSSLGPGSDTLVLARNVGTILSKNVKDIDVVRPDDIADWMDRNEWNTVDFYEVGRGVKADMVVAIEMSGFGLYEGQTLYKGRANLSVTVFDVAQGKEVYRRNLPELAFPANGAYPATDTTESKFRRAFLQVLSDRAARFFYEYDVIEDYGRDPAVL